MDSGRLQELLNHFPGVTVLIVGDFFLDKYLDIDPRLSEPSLETGLEAYQVTAYAGTWPPGRCNNLRALDVNVIALGVVGEDGEGDDLRRGLDLSGVEGDGLIRVPGRFTPTYLKPMLRQGNTPARELNRFDTRNRTPLPVELETEVITRLHGPFTRGLGIAIVDQVPEPNCGVITDRVRLALSELARVNSATIVMADSRSELASSATYCSSLTSVKRLAQPVSLTWPLPAGSCAAAPSGQSSLLTTIAACTCSSWKAAAYPCHSVAAH
jgi:bifunctional ADP-heptose synthase (sugar kinase/adenylyltransferase)